MSVRGLLSYALEVPDVEAGIRFYEAAGLMSERIGRTARLRCRGQDRESVTLIAGGDRKRLHHIALRADELGRIADNAVRYGGSVSAPPAGCASEGLWLTDPHGMVFHLVDRAEDPPLPAETLFEINAPGRIVRTRRSAILPGASYPSANPRRLGHVLVFTPDVLASVEFVTRALGMRLADRAQDVIAFTCAQKNSDHHVIAFAKSDGIGFHHGSFQVGDPDEVGRCGRALHLFAGNGEWGFGRHTIGSNFFHYIQDPWGSWFEYYSDIDFIDDHALWTPTNYGMEDALASWGPAVPHDFVHNYELENPFRGAAQ